MTFHYKRYVGPPKMLLLHMTSRCPESQIFRLTFTNNPKSNSLKCSLTWNRRLFNFGHLGCQNSLPTQECQSTVCARPQPIKRQLLRRPVRTSADWCGTSPPINTPTQALIIQLIVNLGSQQVAKRKLNSWPCNVNQLSINCQPLVNCQSIVNRLSTKFQPIVNQLSANCQLLSLN